MKQVFYWESYTFYTFYDKDQIYIISLPLHLPGHIHIFDIRRLFNEMDWIWIKQVINVMEMVVMMLNYHCIMYSVLACDFFWFLKFYIIFFRILHWYKLIILFLGYIYKCIHISNLLFHYRILIFHTSFKVELLPLVCW